MRSNFRKVKFQKGQIQKWSNSKGHFSNSYLLKRSFQEIIFQEVIQKDHFPNCKLQKGQPWYGFSHFINNYHIKLSYKTKEGGVCERGSRGWELYILWDWVCIHCVRTRGFHYPFQCFGCYNSVPTHPWFSEDTYKRRLIYLYKKHKDSSEHVHSPIKSKQKSYKQKTQDQSPWNIEIRMFLELAWLEVWFGAWCRRICKEG